MANQVFTDGCQMCSAPSPKYASNSGSYVSGKGRFGGNGLALSNSQGNVNFAGNPVTTIFGFAFQISALPGSGATTIATFKDTNGNGSQVILGINADGTLQFFRGSLSTVIGSKSSQSFAPNVIIQVEMKVTVDPASGVAQCRLNGNTSPILNFSGNTRQTSNSYANQLQLGPVASGFTIWYSDIIMFDTGGSAPNDFVGNKRVYTLFANNDSATGGLNQFSTQPSQSAGSHYLNIDDATPPGDTSYNYTSNVSDRESYRTPALPANASGVIGQNIWANVRIDDAGPHSFQISSRASATDAFSADINPGASYGYYSYFQAVDPSTSAAWTPGAVGGAAGSEIGVKLTA